MVSSREAVQIIANTLRRSDKYPDDMSYILDEPDPEGRDSAVSVPVTVLQDIDTRRDDPSNSNFVEYLTNDDGEQVGKIYETKWEMSLQIAIWTASGSHTTVDTLGRHLYEILYQYDSRGPADTFVDADGEPISSIYDFSLRERSRDDSLVETPSVRRWQQSARVRGVQTMVQTADEPPLREYDETIN